MTPTRNIIVGDCLAVLPTLAAGSVHCCVTSPPYFGLRSYLPAGHPDKAKELGSEPTPAMFVATMVEVFRGVRRVLRDDGVCWVNIGDSFAQNGGAHGGRDDNQLGVGQKAHTNGCGDQHARRVPLDAKPGDLLGIPWLLAEALKADGWYLRCDIIWAKKSPMPESINGVRWQRCRVKVAAKNNPLQGYGNASNAGRDGQIQYSHGGVKGNNLATWTACPGCKKCRENGGLVLRRGKWRPTRSHEFVFMLTKREKYFCDAQAVQEAATCGAKGSRFDAGKTGERTNGDRTQDGYRDLETRNPRSVWSLSAEPSKLKHFATYPTKLILPCIKASTSAAGCCPACGACFAPIVESERVPTRPGLDNQIDDSGLANRDAQRHVKRTTVKGFLPTCNCGRLDAVPCTVLDPFNGAGTTGIVAKRLNLNYIGIELNPDYAVMAEKRIEADVPPAIKKKRRVLAVNQRELF